MTICCRSLVLCGLFCSRWVFMSTEFWMVGEFLLDVWLLSGWGCIVLSAAYVVFLVDIDVVVIVVIAVGVWGVLVRGLGCSYGDVV